VRLRVVFAVVAALQFSIAQAEAQRLQLLRDAEIETWLDDHARPIFKAAGVPADEIDIWLIGDSTPNAFAGGLNMGIHTGLLTAAEKPNEIEGVIAHETGHIAGGHSVRSDDMARAAMRPMLLSLVLAAGAIAAGAPDAGMAVFTMGQTVGYAEAAHYSRGQEASADQAAVTYLDGVGKSSKGLIDFFGKLRNYQIITGARINPYLQSHPLAQQRMTSLEQRAKQSPNFDRTDSPEEIERLKLIQAKIWGFMQETNATLRKYPLSDQSDPARYARAVAYYRGSQLDKALVEIDRLLVEHPDNPYFHELKGQMLFEFGRVGESVAPHARSVELAPNEPLLRINLGRALVALEDQQRYPDAIKELKAALLLEPDNGFGWFELARAYAGMGDNAMADLAMAESRFNSGAKAEAAKFARRAKASLKSGTPEWRQAGDILAAAAALEDGEGGESDVPPAPDDDPSPRKPDGEVPDPEVH
jgi:predicted Zn-dependent protease